MSIGTDGEIRGNNGATRFRANGSSERDGGTTVGIPFEMERNGENGEPGCVQGSGQDQGFSRAWERGLPARDGPKAVQSPRGQEAGGPGRPTVPERAPALPT